jgi:uncharacterized protein
VTYLFGQFSPEHLEKMTEGLVLFNEQKYWECHEALEDLWMEDRNDLARNVYWAVIQVAASCIHVRESNLVGARGMLYKAKEKFKKCREHNILSAELSAVLDWKELESLVFAIPDDVSDLASFMALYDFRFKNYLSDKI